MRPSRIAVGLMCIALAVSACERAPTASDSSPPGEVAASAQGPRLATGVYTQCKGSFGAGYVILAAVYSSACPPSSTTWNQYTLGYPGLQESVCGISGIPWGYAIISAATRFDCPNANLGMNSNMIRQMSSPMFVCRTSGTMPYVVTSGTRSFNCPNYGVPGFNAYYIQAPNGVMQACSVSFQPVGWVVTSAVASSICPPSSDAPNPPTPAGPNLYTIRLVSSPMQVCPSWTVPTGYVVISASSSSLCPTYSHLGPLNLYSIKLPAMVEVICAITAIPSGYVVVAYGTNINCPGGNTRTIQKV